MIYAKHTKVPVERSKLELDRLLKRYGAESSAIFTSQDCAVVMFEYRNYRIKFALPYPPLDTFQPSRRGPKVSPSALREQATLSLAFPGPHHPRQIRSNRKRRCECRGGVPLLHRGVARWQFDRGEGDPAIAGHAKLATLDRVVFIACFVLILHSHGNTY
ncbi:MAG: hypothetical protein D6690_14700 [Nitrospirae bacterium]|nr:MAG: hypothetical protein D6690_14700 [Nitrospirota bacterium]